MQVVKIYVNEHLAYSEKKYTPEYIYSILLGLFIKQDLIYQKIKNSIICYGKGRLDDYYREYAPYYIEAIKRRFPEYFG